MSRPSTFSEEMGLMICERLANGESLRKISIDDEMPSMTTIFRWLADERYATFREQYARAREAQADTLADEILDIADDGSNDYMGEDEKYNGDAVQRSRLRVDARKWLAAKLQPKKYGDKIDVTSGGDRIGGEVDEVTRAARLAALAKEINLAQQQGGDAPD